MLTKIFPFLLPCKIEPELPAKLRHLAEDLKMIRIGKAPTEAELASAPLIKDWRAVLTPFGLRIAGLVSGDPLRGTRTTLISQIWAADADDRWVRTLSRFYRLGSPAAAELAETGGGQNLTDNKAGGHSDV